MDVVQHRQAREGTGPGHIPPHQVAQALLLLDMLDQVFPGQMDEVQAAKVRFDTARQAQVQAQRRGDAQRALLLLENVDSARSALQKSILRLGISIIQYGLLAEPRETRG